MGHDRHITRNHCDVAIKGFLTPLLSRDFETCLCVKVLKITMTWITHRFLNVIFKSEFVATIMGGYIFHYFVRTFVWLNDAKILGVLN